MLLFFGCKKNENTRFDYNKGIEASNSFVEAQQMMVQLLNTYFKSLTDSILITDGMSKIDKADVIYYTEPEERILIKYPDWGVIDSYGHRRTNSYEAIPRTSFSDPDVVVDIVFNNFFYDFDTLTVQNMVVEHGGKLDGENDHFYTSADRVYRIYADTTGVLSFNFDQLFVRYKDNASEFTSLSDKFVISGEMVGVTKSNLSFSANIDSDTAIQFNLDCNYMKYGPATVAAERFTALSYVHFPEPDSCLNEYLILINENPFPYPFD